MSEQPITKRANAGRPRDPAKDDAILSAARTLFFERGFSASTIEEIAQRASVSKVTVYKRFGDKETLFETCVRNEIARMATAFDGGAEAGCSLEARLNAFGEALLAFMFRPSHIALDRVTALEFCQMPALGRRTYEAGPGQTRMRLAEVLREASDSGALRCDDPARAAEDLVALWKGMVDIELKFGVRDILDSDTISQRVQHGTRTFLRAYDGH